MRPQRRGPNPGSQGLDPPLTIPEEMRQTVPSTIPPTPDVPTPGGSPLVERIASDVNEIKVIPGFGPLLQVVVCTSEGMPEVMRGAVSAVTVYGDGRIEYHSAPAEDGAA